MQLLYARRRKELGMNQIWVELFFFSTKPLSPPPPARPAAAKLHFV
jgi:hypothetical protein